jgi:hypothetical protein
MSSFKKLNSSDVTIVPYAANKQWNLNFCAYPNDDSYITIYKGTKLTSSFNPDTDPETDKQYERLIYNSINHLFYQSYSGSLLDTSSLANSLFYESASQQKRTQSYFNYNENPALIKNFPSGNLEGIRVLAINQGIFGSQVLPYNFILSSSAYFVVDDGKGNLFDIANAIGSDYVSASYVSGGYFTEFITGSDHIGNIFYAHGLGVITDQNYQLMFPLPPLANNDNYTYKLSDPQKPITPLDNDVARSGTLIPSSIILSGSQSSAFNIQSNGTGSITASVTGLYETYYTVAADLGNDCSDLISNQARIRVNITDPDCNFTFIAVRIPDPSPSPTPSITPSITATPSLTPTRTPSITPTLTQTPTSTPSLTPSITITPTITQTPTQTPTITPSITPSITITPTQTPTSTPSITVSSSPGATPSITPTATPTSTPSVTPSITVSVTRTPSLTPSISPSITPSITVSPSLTPSNTPSISPSITPSITVSPTITPSITPSPIPIYTYLGRGTPDAASSATACSTYATVRGYFTLKSSLASITVGDVIYDSYPSTPTNGGNNWIALKSGGIGDAYSFQIDASGVVTTVGGNCTPPSPTPTQTPTSTTTPSITPSITPSVTLTPTRTPSITPSVTLTPSPTPSIGLSPSRTPSLTPSITPSTSVPATEIQWQFIENNVGNMQVSYNSITSSGTANLQSASLSPTSQNIYAVASSFFDEGVIINYYLNGSFVASYSDPSNADTGTIATSAGNTYKFLANT